MVRVQPNNLAVLALCLLAACAPAPSDLPPPAHTSSAPTATLSAAASPTGSAPPVATTTATGLPPLGAGLPSGQAAMVAAAAADLAERLGAAAAGIELVALIADDLPASDLGCPRKGAPDPVQPALVTGWIIHLRVADSVYEYRAHGSQVVYCRGFPLP